MKLPPIRFSSGWQIEWNAFAEDYICEVCDSIGNENLLLITNRRNKRFIEVTCEKDKDGNSYFVLKLMNMLLAYEEEKGDAFDNYNWEKPEVVFKTHNKDEIIKALE